MSRSAWLRMNVTDLRHADGRPYTWPECRMYILERDGRICYLCGGVATEVDHVIPRRWGGRDTQANLRAICGPCNKAKGDRVSFALMSGKDLVDAGRAVVRRITRESHDLVRIARLYQPHVDTSDEDAFLAMPRLACDTRDWMERAVIDPIHEMFPFEENPVGEVTEYIALSRYSSQPAIERRIADLVRCGVGELEEP